MKKISFKISACAILLSMALVSGCVSKTATPAVDSPASGTEASTTQFQQEFFPAEPSYMMPRETFFAHFVLMKTAWSALGTPYVRGGTTPSGFDCSGFVQWTYKHVGVTLPRTAREQSTVGVPVKKKEEMRVGDIVAFRHPRRGYHTGIYIGEGKFIHSPRTRSVVKVNSLDDAYFRRTFLGARRIDLSGRDQIGMAETLQELSKQTEQEQKPESAIKTSKKQSSKKQKARTQSKKTKTGKTSRTAARTSNSNKNVH